ncbi:MAG TPA: type IV secretion system DNA-binding domain-containing protein [Candidatus Paceibacterota bacterium]|nr:type IV secretion system DNA-binding domain-containing protein [Candidatus Paceibacterota bacterium]
MPEPIDNPVILFGKTTFRQQGGLFGIKMDDRRRHMYIIGKTGMGKSELLKNIAIQDIQDGRGLAFIDPHGDPVEDLLDYIPPERIKDVIYINPADLEFPVAFNVMEHVDADKRHLVADGIMSVFKKLWIDLWSARMEYILNYTILALLEVPDSTLLGINRMLSEKDFRKWVVNQVKDPEVNAFWTKEFASYTDRYTAEAVPAIQNKIGQFVSNTLIRNIVGQPKSSFDMRAAMDQGKILLVNISKGKVGEDASRLLGGLLITKIQLAALSRVDVHQNERRDFVLIVDEFQNFATASFANILSEARKFNLSLVVAHQYVAQMDEAVRDAVFGNVGTIISFRVGAEDAELLEKEFSPEFVVQNIVSLGKREIYLKLMIDGLASKAFSAITMDTIAPLAESTRTQVIDASRSTYGRSREEIESAIIEWRKLGESKEEHRERPRQGRDQPSYNNDRNNRSQGVSLSDAFNKGAVDFKGRKLNQRDLEKKNNTRQDRPGPDMTGLKEALNEALSEKEK